MRPLIAMIGEEGKFAALLGMAGPGVFRPVGVAYQASAFRLLLRIYLHNPASEEVLKRIVKKMLPAKFLLSLLAKPDHLTGGP